MPISILQAELLELDEDTLRDVKAVHAFLKANPDLAFTPDEVATEVHREVSYIAHVLEKFDDVYLVESGTLNDVRYFRYLKDLPDLG